ncbi:MAG TPA: hypothetical protein VLS93_14105 [Anaeromyxobacteraceae bacterium]|nr:hypothetical protein [Anaeromyxobacteraceae bacterium]
MRKSALALAAAAGLLATPAAAGPSVTLNGVSIDGVTDQRFENATVVIDARGNVHIEAKGYAVQAAPGTRAPPAAPAARVPQPATAVVVPPAAAAPAQLTRRYFLATEQSHPDGTQYDVAIFINAQWIREIRSAEPQVVMEITKYLRPGTNKVVLAAQKRVVGERRHQSPSVTLKIVLGGGNVGGGHVMIDEPLVEMVRTAAEVDDRTEEYLLEAR